MAHNLRPATLIGIKRLAKHLKKERGLEYATALDEASRQSGFQDFRHAHAQLTRATFNPYHGVDDKKVAEDCSRFLEGEEPEAIDADIGKLIWASARGKLADVEEKPDDIDPEIRRYIRDALKGFKGKRWADADMLRRESLTPMHSLVLDENQAALINTSSKLEQAFALNGKQLAMLNEDELLTLQFYIDRGRKYGLQVLIEKGEIRVVVRDAKRLDTRNAGRLDYLSPSEGNHFALGLKTAREITLENFRGLGITWFIPKGARVIVKESIGNLILADVFVGRGSLLYGVSLCRDDIELNSQPVTTDDSAPSL